MKKIFKNLIAGILSVAILSSNPLTSHASVGKANGRLSWMLQYPQETGYWCGYSALQTLLNNEAYCNRVILSDITGRTDKVHAVTQQQVAEYVYDKTIQTKNPFSYGGSLDYYSYGNANSTNSYPPAMALTYATGDIYAVYNTNVNTISDSALSNIIRRSVNGYHGVLAVGHSVMGTNSQLPGYNSNCNHYIAIDGYYDYGSYVYIVDPVADTPFGSSNIECYYPVEISVLSAFLQQPQSGAKGIVYNTDLLSYSL